MGAIKEKENIFRMAENNSVSRPYYILLIRRYKTPHKLKKFLHYLLLND